MSNAELLREALRAIRAHALRSFLTLLGIIIGVSTLVGVVSVISGLNRFVLERVIQLAPDVFVVQKFGIIRSREEFLDALKRPNFDWNDYRVLQRNLTLATDVAVQAGGQTAVKYRDRRLADMQVLGTTANYGPMLRLAVTEGRYFTAPENDTATAVVVIGWDIKEELFPQQDPVGHDILVGGAPYRVIGLVGKQGRTLGQNNDNRLYIPLESYRRQFSNRESLNFLIQARGGVPGVEAASEEVRTILRALRHTPFKAPDPFGLITAETLQALWRQISAAAFILSLLIASVSLGVGGIVIMNIMLVAVVERTQEIGMRLAVGARKRDIRRQFLLEAALLSLLGGVVGVVGGALIAFAVRGGLSFPAEVTPPIIAMGLILSLLVGVSAGYWPARTASNLPVVDALRSDG